MDPVSKGLIITGVGFSTVFLFLLLIIISIKVMSKVVLKYFPEKEVVKPTKKSSHNDDEKIAVAIAVAQSQK